MGLFRRRSSQEDDDEYVQSYDRDDPSYAAGGPHINYVVLEPIPGSRSWDAPDHSQLQPPPREPDTAMLRRPHAPSTGDWFTVDPIEERRSPLGDLYARSGESAQIPYAGHLPPAPPALQYPISPHHMPMISLPNHHMESPRMPMPYQGETMSNIDVILGELMRIGGASGAAVVDVDSGMVLGMSGNPAFSLEYAGSGNSEVVRAMLYTMSNVGIADSLEDILITLTTQYHLIRVIETPTLSTLFVYLVLDRTHANLALARHKLAEQTPNFDI